MIPFFYLCISSILTRIPAASKKSNFAAILQIDKIGFVTPSPFRSLSRGFKGFQGVPRCVRDFWKLKNYTNCHETRSILTIITFSTLTWFLIAKKAKYYAINLKFPMIRAKIDIIQAPCTQMQTLDQSLIVYRLGSRFWVNETSQISERYSNQRQAVMKQKSCLMLAQMHISINECPKHDHHAAFGHKRLC